MSDPITIIGSDTVVSGNLEGDEDLTVEGRVEGSISLSRTLTVEVGGVVRADINVRNAVVAGVLVGNVEAQESVHITDQGRVVGDISSPRVILVDGSSFKGNIDMGDFDTDAADAAAAPRRAAVPATSAMPARSRAYAPVAEEAEEAEVVEAPPVRRANPVRTRSTSTPEPAKIAKPASRLPKKRPAKKAPPAPKVRAIGKKKGRKKKA